jgi:hypothetical protein
MIIAWNSQWSEMKHRAKEGRCSAFLTALTLCSDCLECLAYIGAYLGVSCGCQQVACLRSLLSTNAGKLCSLPCRYQHLGSMMSLGATNAAVALPLELPEAISSTLASSPLGPLLDLAGVKMQKGLVLEGPLAQLLRRAAYLYRQPTNEQRLSVAASWLQQAVEVGAKLSGQGSGGKSSGTDRFM